MAGRGNPVGHYLPVFRHMGQKRWVSPEEFVPEIEISINDKRSEISIIAHPVTAKIRIHKG
ncbi:MAG: hypothetical protein ACE5I9_02580 [Candidatus Methylomirabilales bacterium]